MYHYSRKNAKHTFESPAYTQGINLLHFYYPSHSLITMKSKFKKPAPHLILQSPAAPIENE